MGGNGPGVSLGYVTGRVWHMVCVGLALLPRLGSNLWFCVWLDCRRGGGRLSQLSLGTSCRLQEPQGISGAR